MIFEIAVMKAALDLLAAGLGAVARAPVAAQTGREGRARGPAYDDARGQGTPGTASCLQLSTIMKV